MTDQERFGFSHAHLYRLLGHRVRTPAGAGTLKSVFTNRAEVLIDREAKVREFPIDQINQEETR